MRNKLLLIAALFIFAGVGTAFASSVPVDPSIILRDPCPTCHDITITSSNFTFVVDPSGGGIFNFLNKLGATITSLDLVFENPGGINNGNIGKLVNCQAQSYFANCGKSVLSNGSIQILFSGIGGDGCSVAGDGDNNGDDTGPCGGILNDTTFTLDLFNQKHGKDTSTGGWVPGSSVGGVAASPEPGTFLLLLSAVPLIALRKRS